MSHDSTQRRDDRLIFSLALITVVLCWEAAVRLRWISPASYAAPSEICVAVSRLLVERQFIRDIAYTAGRALAGTAIGFPLGVLLALAIHALGRSQTAAERLLDFVRSIPITALIPIFIGIYGIGDKNKVAIGAFSALLVTSITVWLVLKQGKDVFRTLIHLYRPSYWNAVRLIFLPHAMPAIIAALRLAVSSSLVLVVVAEMFVGTQVGIGKVVNDMTYTDDRATQYAAVTCAGILGYALNAVCEWLHRRTRRWYDLENTEGVAHVAKSSE